jgi:antibiotic biosynthesis monooxygenase (ABM) superfamily enzyme
LALWLERTLAPYAEELQARKKLENSKANKREGSMVRRFESIAGTATQRHLEESASRQAFLAQVQSLAQDAANLDKQCSTDLLEFVKELRESLRRE